MVGQKERITGTRIRFGGREGQMNKLTQKYRALSVETKAALWFAMCNFLNKGIAMIVVPLYTRLLSTEEYGTYTVFQSWLNIFVIIATLEISRGHYKIGITKYNDDVDRYTTSVMGLSNAVTLVFFAAYLCAIPVFNSILKMPTHVVLWMFIYLLVYPAWEFWAIQQRFAYKYKTMVFATLLVAILSPLAGMAGILFFDMQSDAAIFSKLGIQGIIALLIYLQFLRKKRSLFVGSYWKQVFIFNITLVPYLLSTTILNQADRIMISDMVGTAEAAIYSVAYSIAMLMQLVNNAVSDAFIPWMYRRLKGKQYSDIEPITNKLLILVAAMNLLVVLFAPEVLAIFAPSRYYSAIWIIPPVTASVFFMFLFQRYINVEVYYGATSSVSTTSILVALLNIGLNYVCIEQWGYLAAGYTTLASYIIFCFAHYFNLKRICRKHSDGHQIFTAGYTLGFSIIFLGLIFVMMGLYNYWVIRYALALALCGFGFYKRDFVIWLLKNKKADND